MKIRLINYHNLNKSQTKSRTHLVKVAVQVNGRFGQYSSHRWKSPDSAFNILKVDMRKQGFFGTDTLIFVDKKTHKLSDKKKLLDAYKESKTNKTLQQFVKENYTVKPIKSVDNLSTKQIALINEIGGAEPRQFVDNYNKHQEFSPYISFADYLNDFVRRKRQQVQNEKDSEQYREEAAKAYAPLFEKYDITDYFESLTLEKEAKKINSGNFTKENEARNIAYKKELEIIKKLISDIHKVPGSANSGRTVIYDDDADPTIYDKSISPFPYKLSQEARLIKEAQSNKVENQSNEKPQTTSVTNDEKDAIEHYVSGEGMWINQHLRGIGNTGELSEKEKAYLEALKSATNKPISDEIDTLYRAVDASAVFGNMSRFEFEELTDHIVYKVLNNNAVNKIIDVLHTVITEKGFMSTTKKLNTAMDWGDFTGSDKGIVLELSTPSGAKGIDVNTLGLDKDKERLEEDSEVLLHPGTQYTIEEISSKEGQIYIKATILNNENKSPKSKKEFRRRPKSNGIVDVNVEINNIAGMERYPKRSIDLIYNKVKDFYNTEIPTDVTPKVLKASRIVGRMVDNAYKQNEARTRRAEINNLYEMLKNGTITLQQALNNPQFKDSAFLLLIALSEDEETLTQLKGEIIAGGTGFK